MHKGQSDSMVEEKTSAKIIKKKDQNIFKISPLSGVHYKDTVIANFGRKRRQIRQKKQPYSCNNDMENGSSKSYIDTADKERSEELSITPRFNFDSKYYTAGFIIPYQGEESDAQMQRNHKSKLSQSSKQIDVSNILIPKPKSKNQYCAVCKFHYEDYLNHINDYQHKKNIKKCKFNNDIEYLTILIKERMKNNEKDGVMTRSAKKRMSDHDYFELEMKGNKKRKGQNIFNVKPMAKNNQEKDDLLGDGQTPFNKKWNNETTVKSIYSALD